MNEELKEFSAGGFLISKIHQLSQRIFSKILREYELDLFNPSQGRVIFLLLQNDNIPIHDLVEKTQLTKSTLSSHLDNLERIDFVKKIQSKDDKRETFIILTEKALKLKQDYIDVSRNMTKLFYDGFSEEEINQFEGYLQRCLQNLIKNK
ncbi:MAG: MarR family transcriptional regulator [Candidatus Lokiarchaeota archaeon]|nr:MarR family transcriptional regulator [Candidatus Lokiarchaeota archaeon]